MILKGTKVIDCIYEKEVLKAQEKVELENGEKAELVLKRDRKKLLDKYIGFTKLNKPLKLEETLDLEEDAWLY